MMTGVVRAGLRMFAPSRTLATLLAAAVLLTLMPIVQHTPAVASSDPTDKFCRGTTATGAALETNKDKNGFFQAGGIEIEPVFSRLLYVDPGRDFDAAYIGYRIRNLSAGTQGDLWIEVADLNDPTKPVQLVDAREGIQRIGAMSNSTSNRISRYFLVRANATTDQQTWHTVNVWNGQPGVTGSQKLATCYTNIDGVKRSLSANANKVTGISVSGTPAIGETLTVTVTGNTGAIGSGNDVDGAIIALSPATSRRWPARAVRLETAVVEFSGIRNNNLTSCSSADLNGTVVTGSAGGSNRFATYSGTLALRNMRACAPPGTKLSYTATYTFRVLAPAATAPVIRPYASIASGTQVKYTGSLPSTDVALPIDEASVEVKLAAEKTFLGATLVNGTEIDVSYRVRVGRPNDDVTRPDITLDAIEDLLDADGVLQSVTVTDALRTASTTIAVGDVTTSTAGVFPVTRRFPGLFTVSNEHPVVLEYVIRLPKPASGTSTVTNYAYALSGQFVIGSGANLTGIEIVVADNGSTTTAAVTQANRQGQTITFTPAATIGEGASIALNGITDSGLPVYYEIAGTSAQVCSVSEFNGIWTLTGLATGDCDVTAKADGTDSYAAATPVTRTITVLPGQFITSPGGTFGAASTIDVSFTATSKLEVAVTSLDPDVCTATFKSFDAASGDTVYTVAKGTVAGACLLSANQPGDGTTWGPAPEFELVIGVGTAQTLSFTAPNANQEFTLVRDNDAWTPQSVSLSGTTDANTALSDDGRLPLFFSSRTPQVCQLEPLPLEAGEATTGLNTTTGVTTQTLTFRDVGTCTVVADQDGTNNLGEPSVYALAPQITRSFTVLSNATTEQFLFVNAPTTKTYGDAVFTVSASSRQTDSATGDLTNLSVQLAGTPGICAVGTPATTAGITTASVSLLQAGNCVITATQPGNEEYKAAVAKTATIAVGKRTVQLSGVTVEDRVYDGTTTASITGTPSLTGVVPGDTPTQIAVSGSVSATFGTAAAATAKPVTVNATLGGTKADSYELAAPANLTATITPRPVDVLGLTATPRTYNGQTTVEITGTPTLRLANDSALNEGVITGDDVQISGSPTGTASSPDVGTRNVTVAGLSLTGDDRTSYAFKEPDVTVAITQRAITVTPADQSVRAGEPAQCQVISTNLISGDTVTATCTYTNVDGGATRNPGADNVGDEYTIALDGVTVTHGDPAVDVTGNYSVTKGTGTLAIGNRTTPTVTPGNATVTIVYGTSFQGLLDTTATDNGNPVPGTFTHRIDETGVDGTTIKNVGDHTVVTTFVPTDGTAFNSVTVTRTITVTPRPVALEGVEASYTFVYSGDSTYPLAGTFTLEADDGSGTGLLGSDAASVSLTGTARLSRNDESSDITVAGTPAAATVTSLSLTGAKTENYQLQLPANVSVNVTPRPITISAQAQTIAPGDSPACTTSVIAITDGSLVSSDTLGTITCEVQDDNENQVSGSLTAGTYRLALTAVTFSAGNANNYDVTLAFGELTVEKLTVTIEADTTTIVYGESFTSGLATVKARQGGQDVSGTLAFKRQGNTVDGSERLTVGNHTVTVEFTPTQGNRFNAAAGTKTVTVTPRPLTVTPRNQFRLVGDPDPVLDVSVSGLLTDDAGMNVGTFVRSGQRTTTVGAHPLRVGGGTQPANYQFQFAEGTLYVADVAIDVAIDADNVLQSNVLACECEGLVPGMELTLTINSTPLVLATGVAADDGTCPNLAGTIPDDFDEGDHTLVLAIEDGASTDLLAGGTVEQSQPVVVGVASVPPTNTDPPAPQPPVEPISPDAPDVPDVPDVPDAPDTPAAIDSGPDTPPLAAPGVPSAPPVPPRGPLPQFPALSNPLPPPPPPPPAGAPLPPTSTPPSGSLGSPPPQPPQAIAPLPQRPQAITRAIQAVQRFVAVRIPTELASERIGGFASGAGLRVEVHGARSVARFIVTRQNVIDGRTMPQVLPRTAGTQRADFAQITAVDVDVTPRLPRAWSVEEQEAAAEMFAEAGLPAPRLVTEVSTEPSASSRSPRWERVDVDVATYLPGSTVYLAVTSDPMVLDAAVVNRDGTATLSGSVPLHLLSFGEHRVRVVGVRALDGVSTDDAGEVVLSEALIQEIQRFDSGTVATVLLTGPDVAGGLQVAVRVVPLEPRAPWWTLLFIVAAGGAIGRARRKGGRILGHSRLRSGALLALAAVPAIVLGWYSTVTLVAYVGILLAGASPFVLQRITPAEPAQTVDVQ